MMTALLSTTALAAIFAITQSPSVGTSLTNAGFESATPHEAWTLHVYGAEPYVMLDGQVTHSGRQSLSVSADEPSDVAFGQELQLKPGCWYRLTGWVRTKDLDPRGAPTCGTFQVQQPGGTGIIASGRNHSGTQDWVREEVYFTPPSDGRTRIAVFFVGYGKGTGTAWFDDLSLEEVPVEDIQLQITPEPLCQGEISPFQYGQFIEYLCALTPSMFSEKLFDGSFEGVPPYGFTFRQETDRLEQPWYPDGAVHRGLYTFDTDAPYNGKRSQRIAMKPGDPATIGISQSGLSVTQNEPLKLSVFLKANEVTSPVHVTIWGEGVTYGEATFEPSADWQRFTATIVPTGTDHRATCTISFRGPGTLWVDQVSLMPEDNVFGWRSDVATALKALKPGIIRFGGSTTEGFEWTDTIGDPTRRVPFTTYWGGLEPGNAGLEEFVQLCQWVGAEPLICIRFTGKTPQDAADQVEYFNGRADSPMGQRRVANGHAEPYGVKYWQIGNELGDETYQAGVAAFCAAMKRVDPSIKLLAAFPSEGLLQKAGPYLDYVCPHHYGCDNLPAMEADAQRLQASLTRYVPDREIRLAITEWNTTAGDWGLDRARLWTLDNALACARYHNFMHRHCDLIEIANRSNLTDSFCSGIIQTNNHALYKTPTYYIQELYATQAGQIPVKIQLRAATDSQLPTDLPADLPDLALDCSATLTADRSALILFAVNHTNDNQERTLDVSAFRVQGAVTVFTLADSLQAGERDVTNSWQSPERIRTQSTEIDRAEGVMPYRFPPLSVTCLRFRLAAR